MDTRKREITDSLNYGNIIIKIKKIMDERKISVYRLSILTGLKHQTVQSYYKNAPLTRVDLDVLSKLCYVLDCKIEDILEYVPNN
ncbi:MAG: helix-turn-helix transcriptional regulator [bacterium]|nr:helix-turn-helix transcriptional regulator [bacterium]